MSHQINDDIFALWPHGKQQLNNFLHPINSMHTDMEFIIEIGEEGRLTSWLKEETTDALDILHSCILIDIIQLTKLRCKVGLHRSLLLTDQHEKQEMAIFALITRIHRNKY